MVNLNYFIYTNGISGTSISQKFRQFREMGDKS